MAINLRTLKKRYSYEKNSVFHYLNMISSEFNGYTPSPTKVVECSFKLATSVGFIIFQFQYNSN
ncbi:hypothetical protein DZB90_25080 [Bacillus thuringiensis]|nr:hypothetical protein DZB90_25080 [Bacillus thuringiensis]